MQTFNSIVSLLHPQILLFWNFNINLTRLVVQFLNCFIQLQISPAKALKLSDLYVIMKFKRKVFSLYIPKKTPKVFLQNTPFCVSRLWAHLRNTAHGYHVHEVGLLQQ